MTDTLSNRIGLSANEAKGQTFDLTTTPALRKRRAKESRFKAYGLIAILISLAVLVLLVGSTFFKGVGVLTQTEIGLDITYSENVFDPTGERDPDAIRLAAAKPLLTNALSDIFPDAGDDRETRRAISRMLSAGGGYIVSERVAQNPDLIGTTERIWIPANSNVDQFIKGKMDVSEDESLRALKDRELSWIATLQERGQIERKFNKRFFTSGDSREPELSGMLGALIGSFFTVLTCFFISFPIGLATAVYLEEFAPKNRFTDFIEVNINNLAAVPSIVYGLLGLYMFLTVFGLPRSTPLVGGMVLALMALPIIIIASRASLKSVPQNVRDAALGLGASKVQTTFHHVVPLAMPGMLTGTIIAMARALGETAPLLMIGMVAFIVEKPNSVIDAATTLPVQVFLWFDSPERAFQERASATIIVLLIFLVLMNLMAVLLRRKLERRW